MNERLLQRLREVREQFGRDPDDPAAVEGFHDVLALLRRRHAADVPDIEAQIAGRRAPEAEAFAEELRSVLRPAAGAVRHAVHLFADSLAMPRPSEGVALADTYPAQVLQALQDARPGAIDGSAWARRALTSTQLAPQVPERLARLARAPRESFIVHVGMVDCAPRVLLDHDISLALRHLGREGGTLLREISARHVAALERVAGNRVFVRLEEFADNLGRIVAALREFAPRGRVYLVTLMHSEVAAARRDHRRNVIRYNRALAALCGGPVELVDVTPGGESDPAFFVADGYHLSQAGHRHIAGLLLGRLQPADTLPTG